MKKLNLEKRTVLELNKLLREKRKEWQDLRFKLTTGRVKDIKQVAKVKKDIARILTILNQKKHA